ncbi:MAG: glycosyltransferase [Sedimentisphaeraceae bacterium JB056]
MRFLVISNYYPPYYKGGYELACRDTCEFLASRGHDVFILTGIYGIEKVAEDTGFSSMEPVRKLTYIDYENSSFISKHKVEKHNYRVVSEAINTVKPDLIYIWNMQGVSIAPVIAAQDSKCLRIFEIGDLWPDTYAAYDIFDRIKFGIKAALPFTIGGKLELSPIISVSDWIGREMSERYGSRKVYSVPNGIRAPQRIKSARNEGVMKYIFTGRIDPQKGIDTAIRAFGQLVAENKIDDFVFDIYGSGDDKWLSHCRDLAQQLGLSDCVNFRGRVDNVIEIYADYDIMIMPTMMREPFGMVTVEAMAAGLPVIATNKYGPAEIVTDGVDGLLFDPGDYDQLAEKILLLHTNKELYSHVAAAAREKYIDNYQMDNIKSRVEKILIAQIEGQENTVSRQHLIIG